MRLRRRGDSLWYMPVGAKAQSLGRRPSTTKQRRKSRSKSREMVADSDSTLLDSVQPSTSRERGDESETDAG